MSRRNRLSRSRDFDSVYRSGRSVSTRYLTLYAFARPGDGEDGEPRLGLAVSRQVGGAVVRNRVKRQLRECFADLADGLPRGLDYVLIARPGLAETAERRGFEWLRERVVEIFGIAQAGGGSSSEALTA